MSKRTPDSVSQELGVHQLAYYKKVAQLEKKIREVNTLIDGLRKDFDNRKPVVVIDGEPKRPSFFSWIGKKLGLSK